MKYKNILFVATLIIVSFCACNSRSKSESTNSESTDELLTINFPDKLSKEYCPLSQIADTVLFIPLETTTKSFIGNIRSIQFNDSIIIIYDGKKLLTFNWEGKFIREIGTYGKGPGEHLSIFNFVLDKDTVYISSTGKFGLEKFTLGGEYLGFISQKFQMVHFTRYNDDGYVWYNDDLGQLWFFNNQWENTDTLTIEQDVSKKRQKYCVMARDDQYFIHTPNETLFKNYINDTVWNISEKRKTSVMRFNLKNRLLPKELQVEYTTNHFQELSKPYDRVNVAMSTDSLTILTIRKWYSSKGFRPFYIYNKTTGKIKGYEYARVHDDIVSHANYCVFHRLSDRYMLLLMDYSGIVDGKKEAKTSEEKAFWEHLSKGQSMNSNPILVVVKLK